MSAISGRGNRVPTVNREIAELRAEVRRLSAALRSRPAQPSPQEFMPFSWAGTASGERLSGPWPSPGKITVTQGVLGCSVTGGGVTAALQIDGSTVHTFTLGAGSSQSQEQVRIPVLPLQQIRLSVNAGGVEDFTAFIGFIRDVVHT